MRVCIYIYILCNVMHIIIIIIIIIIIPYVYYDVM